MDSAAVHVVTDRVVEATMEAWIPLTIFAAFCQNLRSALQKRLQAGLSTTGATFVRFGYAFPLAIGYTFFLHLGLGHELPAATARFTSFAVIGGVAQILGTALLLYVFTLRNFVVGTTYSKTEAVQAAVFGIVVLGEPISTMAAVGVLVSLAGVVFLSAAHDDGGIPGVLRGLTSRSALGGMASGSFFGLAAVAYRGASLALDGGTVPIRAAFTLATVTTLQTLLMAAYMSWREPGELGRCGRAWRVGAWVGLAGMLASAGWFTAMTLQNAAYVRALGQVELVFTFAASLLFFGERTNPTEALGIALVVGGLLVLVLG